MIQIRELHFAYASDGFGLQIDELSVAPGERVAWIGPSGAGKTTLLRLVAGIVSSATGQIESCGVNLIGLHDAARRSFRISNVGLVFQDFSLVEYLTVLDNILLPYRINRSLRFDTSVRTRAEQLAASLGLLSLLSRRPTRLSHGERQRVAVCRALIASPKLILADEPTANLDAENASRVLDALDQYSRQQAATLVVVTHDRTVLDRFERTIDVSPFSQRSPVGVGEASDER